MSRSSGGPTAKESSLRRLLTVHESALVFLVVVTVVLGGLWGAFWQQTSIESVRLNALAYTAQKVRSDLFRQIKEVTIARLMEDENALRLYAKYSRQIDQSFNELRQQSETKAEQEAVQAMQVAYRVVQSDMNTIFDDPYMLNRVARMKILDPRYEQHLVGAFERTFIDLDAILSRQLAELNQRKAFWLNWMPIALPVPLLLAIWLVVFSRRSLRLKFVRPMDEIVAGAQRISTGELTQPIAVSGVGEIATLATTMNQMAADLARSRDALVENEKQAALGALVPVVAHNIRNPLATIRASAQLLDSSDTREEINEVKHAIVETVDRLGRWVNALVSYLHPLKPQRRPAQLSQIIDASLRLLKPKLEEKSLVTDVQVPIGESSVNVDVDLLEQALFGLLGNAVEASPQGGCLRISVTGDACNTTLAIEDEGPGLPFEPHPRDFHPGPTTKRLGTGLGIPFAYKVCSLHGAKLSFERAAPGGTRVVIEFSRPLGELEHE